MSNCCICGANLNNQNTFTLSKELHDYFICSNCAHKLRRLYKLASSGDKKFKDEIETFISDIDSNLEIEDSVLEYISSFIHRIKRTYNNACKARDNYTLSSLKRGPIRSDNQSKNTINAWPKNMRFLKHTLIVAGVIVSIIAIILITVNKVSLPEATTDPLAILDSDSSNQGTDEINNYANPQYVTAYGNFSEGKAFALVDGRGCYIDRMGNILFYLPDDLQYGLDYSGGYAVITSYDYRYGGEGDSLSVALIDETGNTVIPVGVYDLIGPVSEGMYFTKKVTSTYEGTDIVFALNDLTGREICTLQNANLDNYGYDSFEMASVTQVHNGILYRFRKIRGDVTIDTYDLSGNLLGEIEDAFLLPSPSPVYRKNNTYTRISCGTGYALLGFGYGGSQAITNLLTGEVLNHSKWPSDDEFTVADYIFTSEGYALLGYSIDGKDSFYLVNTKGERVSDFFDIPYSGSYLDNASDGLWIIPLANYYYGVYQLERDSNNLLTVTLMFEPVQERLGLEYLGSNLFWGELSGNVYDKNGDVAFTLPSDFCDIGATYSEGFMIGQFFRGYSAGEIGDFKYIALDGTVISTLDQMKNLPAS